MVVGATTSDLSFSGANPQPGPGGPGGGNPPPGGQGTLPDAVLDPVADRGTPNGTDTADAGDVDPGGAESPGGSGPGGAGTGAGGGGSGSGSGGGGGGGSLPFTGLAVGAVAAVGSALTAAGTALRKRVRRRET